MRPELMLVTGILPFQTSIFKAIKEGGGRIANYLTDDPWNPIHSRRSFLRNLRHYDHIFSTKQALCERLERAGTPSTSWLPFAHDPALHHPPLEKSSKQAADVLFVIILPSLLEWIKDEHSKSLFLAEEARMHAAPGIVERRTSRSAAAGARRSLRAPPTRPAPCARRLRVGAPARGAARRVERARACGGGGSRSF